jgi:hypothetical protein
MSSGTHSEESDLSAKCGGSVYVAYACHYPTGRKLLVDDVILRVRYVAAVSTRRTQVKSACPFRNSASEFCRTVGASPRRRAVAQLRRGPRLKRFYVGDDGSRLARRYRQNHQKAELNQVLGAVNRKAELRRVDEIGSP